MRLAEIEERVLGELAQVPGLVAQALDQQRQRLRASARSFKPRTYSRFRGQAARVEHVERLAGSVFHRSWSALSGWVSITSRRHSSSSKDGMLAGVAR